MSGGWWAAKVRRFARYFVGRVGQVEREELAGWLTPAQVALFGEMHPADQRHGLDVVRALRHGGNDDADLLLAGLLHDCGKGRSLRVWHRVGWSLAEHYGPRVERQLIRAPGFRPAFRVMAEHAERSAELATAAGVNALVADLIRHQAEPRDDERARALLLADQAN